MTRRKGLAIWFKDLDRWDIKTAVAAAFRASHPDFVPLGHFVEECTVLVRPYEEPEKLWPVYGVTNRKGVVLSHWQKGQDFNVPYKGIQQDWFFHNPTRANVGSLGRVPKVEEDAVTSPEYQVWRVKDPTWLPEYVEILIQVPFFNKLIHAHRVGAVKERLYAQNLMQIPVPPVGTEFQKAVVVRWAKAQEAIKFTEAQVFNEDREVFARCLQLLGLSAPKAVAGRRVFAVNWQDFARWSVGYNQATSSLIDLEKGTFPVVSMGDVLEMLQYGTSEKANTVGEGTLVVRMNNIVDGELDFSDMKHVVLPEKAKKAVLLEEGDVLINRTNSKELVGKCAVFHGQGEYVFASYLIRVRVDTDRILPDFLAYIVNSTIGRRQVDALSRQIIGQANINSEELRSLQVPLPPLDKQQEILRIVDQGREKISQARSAALKAGAEVKAAVEAMILGVGKAERKAGAGDGEGFGDTATCVGGESAAQVATAPALT